MNKILREKQYPNGSVVVLIQGDITLAEVDAIVNPANQMLQHGGGLAGLLSMKAGPVLQKESNTWIEEHGPVSHENPASTSAGELPFKTIIHAVGPVWGSGDEKQKLELAVHGALSLAEESKMSSVALPAISTGIFGFPLQEAAIVILGAVDAYISQSSGKLRQVQVVLYDDLAGEVFSTAWDQTFL